MPITFLVSDESINRYGYRILSAGLDVKQFLRNPVMYDAHGMGESRGEVIGRWENLRLQGTEWLADAVFDKDSKRGQEIACKVENNFIRMASIGTNPIEVSDDPLHLLEGQERPTVTKSELLEISIVSRGGNDNALRLSAEGEVSGLDKTLPLIQLSEKKRKLINTDKMSLKTIAIALGLEADATEVVILSAIKDVVKKEKTATEEANQFKTDLSAQQEAEAISLVDRAVVKGLIPETLKGMQLSAFGMDHEGSKAKLEALLLKAPAGSAATESNQKLTDHVASLSATGPITPEQSFDYLQKKEPKKLASIKLEAPEEYAVLLQGYTDGVRYNNKKQ